ncbi:nuclear transport factor 2 family protein [Geodermatophilus maliterrae]|uniref:Nuclear transport factor 2 family protein n=1 Tax=Geodermatophilus maliterrae TaxID=3162531 RepID=A0ABV3XCG9_9ACTN
MSDHPHVTRLLEAYEAFGKGDLDRLTELWSPDIQWHEPGRNQVSGDYAGPPAVFEVFGRIMEHSQGSFRIEPLRVFADDTDGVAVVRMSGHTGDRDLDVLATHVVRFEGDCMAEFWAANTDQAAVDAFFA